MGAAQLPAVAVRKLVESKAVKEKSLCDCRLQVYERQPVDSFGSIAYVEEMGFRRREVILVGFHLWLAAFPLGGAAW